MKYGVCEHEGPGLMPEAAAAPGGCSPCRLPGLTLRCPSTALRLLEPLTGGTPQPSPTEGT